MKLDTTNLKIEIDFYEPNGPVFNAFALTEIQCLTFTPADIKLTLWHEGTKNYHETDGLFDAKIAHELGHIFHKHHEYDSSKQILKEFEADQTGVQCLKYPINMIADTFMMDIAKNLFYSLKNRTIPDKTNFFITYTISSTLIKKYPDLGSLGNCTTHAQFEHNFDNALKALEGRKFKGTKELCSLIYEQLLTRCLQADQLPENYEISNKPATHPCPRERKAAILAYMQEQRDKEAK